MRWRDPSGQQRKKSFHRKQDAEGWAASNSVDLWTGNYIDPRRGKVTLGEFVDQWLSALGHLKASSRARTTSVVEMHVRPRWGTTPLTSITHAEVQVWVTTLGKGLSARSVRKIHGTLMQVLDWAIVDKRLATNPAKGIRLPRPPITEHRYLDHAEVAMLAKECGDYATLIRVMAYTGLRWGEAAALRTRRVDLTRRRVQVVESVTEVNGVITWGTPKTHSRRAVPLPRFLVRELTTWVERRRPDDLLFPAPRGGVLRVRNFRRNVLTPASTRLGLDGFHPHELRHTAASLAIASGADVKVVQQMLGHKSATLTLDLYGHLFPDRLDELADRFDDAVCAPGVPPEPDDDRGEDDQ